jgi:hypothetical protein
MLRNLRSAREARTVVTVFNVLLGVLVVLNAYYFFARTKEQFIPRKRPVRFPQDIPLIPPAPEELDFEDDELETAVEFLNLPTWSRGYVPCSDPTSEVTCSQVVRAYRLIKGWEYNISETPMKKRRYFVLKHPVKGMGNKMTTDINAFAMALMSNRSVLVTSNFPVGETGVVFEHAYSFPKSVMVNRSQLPRNLHSDSRHFVNIPADIRWSCWDVKSVIFGKRQFVGMDDLLYGIMIYANQQTAEWCWENFGGHAAYFIGNYFSRFPEKSINRAKEILSTVPRNQRVLGVHIRFHRAGQYYSHGLNQTMPVVYEEIDRRLAREKGLMLAVATDNLEIKRLMLARYGRKVLMTDALRRPDKDHGSAQNDMALLLGSDEIIATYRSTFSWIIVSKSGRRAWWIEKEAPHWFPASNSQATGVSMVYHWRDHCDWRTNDRVAYCGPAHRETLQKFYDYLVL